jgi:predicted O-methyltransferase YrrM
MLTRILEIGTGTGESTVALARQLAPDGMLITMQSDPSLTALARERIAAAGFAGRVSVIAGEPGRFLHKIRGPFDLIVQNDPDDADRLHERLIGMLRPGAVLIRGGKKYS